MTSDTHISVPDDLGGGKGQKSGPMTPSQASRLKNLCAQTGVPFDEKMNSKDAAKKIKALEGKQGQSIPGDG